MSQAEEVGFIDGKKLKKTETKSTKRRGSSDKSGTVRL
jgi:hypothetical protein